MAKFKTTKHSLFSSVIALILCITMLLGTTMAWFTDTAINRGNKVQAGMLKVDLLKGVGEDDYDSIDEGTNNLFESTFWQPDETRVVYLGIENKGNLDLRYYVNLEVYQPEGQNIDMTEVMQYNIIPDAEYGDDVSWNPNNAQSVVLGKNPSVGEAELAAGAIHYFALVVHMDADADNKYQGQEITFDIEVTADQMNKTDKDEVIDNVRLFFDGAEKTYGASAVKSKYGVFMVPVEGTFKALGAEVSAEGNVYTVTYGEETIKVTVDSDKADVSGTEVTLETPVSLSEGIPMVPLSFVGEALGYVTEYVKERNAVMIWDTTQEIVDSLKKVDALYGRDLLEWLASLYDPGTGGVYYSLSARNNEGFWPDLESTYQFQYLLYLGGMIDWGDSEDVLPDSIKDSFVNFARERQSEADGYFYDVQFGTGVTSSKKSRDYSYSRDLIRMFDGTFKYTLAEERVNASAVATSAINTTSTSNCYESEDSFLAYLNSLDWSQDDLWGVGNELASQISEIKSAGLIDVATEFIAGKQNNYGLWGNDELDVRDIDAAMKLSAFFTADTMPYPNVEEMMNGFLSVYSNLDPQLITEVYNPISLLNNVRKSYGGNYPEEIQKEVDDAISMIIETVADYIELFKKDDGGYGYLRSAGQSQSQGAVKSTGVNESDVNGAVLAVNIRYAVYAMLGYSVPSVLDIHAGWFVEDLLDNEAIEKQAYVPPTDIPTISVDDKYNKSSVGFSEDFEDIPVGYRPGGELWSYTHKDESLKSSIKVVENPDESEDMVLRFLSQEAGIHRFIVNYLNNGEDPEKITVSFDFRLDSASYTDYLYALIGRVCYWQITGVAGDKYNLSYRTGSAACGVADYTKTYVEGLDMKKWYNTKIEYTLADHSTKIYVDGELKAEFDEYMQADALNGIGLLCFYTFQDAYGDLYVDDLSMTVE